MDIHNLQQPRKLHESRIDCDLTIVGGGLSGVCTAITAAREGLTVVLVQDRPVLGGNASSEVRLWALGATSHMGNNNRWAREGGIIDEIMVENLHRNPEGNPVLFDAVLLDKVFAENNITLLLDTAVFKIDQDKESLEIRGLWAFSSLNESLFEIRSPLFCDSSGDGILGYLSGADFRVGAEGKEEFDEPLAPDEFYGELLGHTIYFYSKDTGAPVEYIAPDFALKDITEIPRMDRIKASDTGCSFWWLEYGGRLDTVHENQEIKKELWKVSYGIWDYIKNSGKFPEAENLTLEWVGMIPGKRESRRFEGDYMLRQSDIIEQRLFDDAVSYGGWAVDLHPADGLYSERPPCNQFHSKGVYQIPYRCYYSRSVPNLFLNGRLISASHVAFGSTRVMMTGAHGGQAVGMAAVWCRRKSLLPRELLKETYFAPFRNALIRTGHYIPFLPELEDPDDLVAQAVISATSTLAVEAVRGNGTFESLEQPAGMLLPLPAGSLPSVFIKVMSSRKGKLKVQLRKSVRPGNFTPEQVLEEIVCSLQEGENRITIPFTHQEKEPFFGVIALLPDFPVRVECSDQRLPGFLSLYHEMNEKVAKSVVQEAPEGSGIESFEFWLPRRRPDGKLLAMTFDPPLLPYTPDAAGRGEERPAVRNTAWVPSPDDPASTLCFSWAESVSVAKIMLSFDTDFDHAMESAQWKHPERHIPSCVRHFRVFDGNGNVLAELDNNYSTRQVLNLGRAVMLKTLSVQIVSSWGAEAGIFRVRIFSSE